MLGVDADDNGDVAFRGFVALVMAVQLAGAVVAGGDMFMGAADSDAAGFFTALVGAFSGSGIAAVLGVAGMMLAEAVSFRGLCIQTQTEGQCQGQRKAYPAAKKGCLHGVSSWR